MTVLRERYFQRDEAGQPIEDFRGMLQRVATAVAEPCRCFGEDTSLWEERFLQHMVRLEFLPNSPTLMNAGLPGGQLAACFVLPIEDDLDSIFTALHHMSRIHQTGGGTGFSFSALRPHDDRVRSTGGVTSGPLSFMELFDHATALIREGGRRRGANMAVLRIDHPDIEEFIGAKRAPDRLQHFNLSVGITDEFFAALEGNQPFALRNPRTRQVARMVDPAMLFDAIVEAAWATGDPGLLFLDEINRHNPTPMLGMIEATNPCGEQPLLANESCVLGSINLGAFATSDGVDWARLGVAIHDAVVFLDNVIEATAMPFAEIEQATRRTRKIGLGVMGFADLLAQIGVPYDSEDGVTLGKRIAAHLTHEARATSARLGESRGSFPAFPDSEWPRRGFSALRNATVTCIAPTGTIGLMAGASSGIEPYFALAIARRLLDGKHVLEINAHLAAALEPYGSIGDAALSAVKEHGTMPQCKALPSELRKRFPTALEMTPDFHARMQAAFQAHMDAGVSKTVNLPAAAPPGVVRHVFQLAHRLRLKGITVYRYGSRANQTLFLPYDETHACRDCAV